MQAQALVGALMALQDRMNSVIMSKLQLLIGALMRQICGNPGRSYLLLKGACFRRARICAVLWCYCDLTPQPLFAM